MVCGSQVTIPESVTTSPYELPVSNSAITTDSYKMEIPKWTTSENSLCPIILSQVISTAALTYDETASLNNWIWPSNPTEAY